jgi:type II secretory pathway pseudopilin PulG
VSEAGYTLVETLAALMMIGLAIGGLIEASHVLGRMQAGAGRSLAETARLRGAGEAMRRLFEGQGCENACNVVPLRGGFRVEV